MRYLRNQLLALVSTLAALACPGSGAVAEPLDVMTFNLRYAHAAPNSWAERRPVVRALLEHEAPDLVGTQEGVHGQITDLENDLPAYEWVGTGRDGDMKGEFMAIFYRRDRFDALERDHFWLSDTPAIAGSRTWGNRFARMVTWVRLRDRATACELYVVNTHFDHEVQAAREKSADLLLERVQRFDPALPVVLLGDFNAPAGANPVYDKLTGHGRVDPQRGPAGRAANRAGDATGGAGSFVDTWRALGKPEPTVGTFHNFNGVEAARGTARIDWILTRGAVRARSTEILTYAQGSQYPSDHFPVVARIEIESCR